MSRYNAKTQDMTDKEFVQSTDKDKIFSKVVEPLKKKRVYGLGNKGYIDSSNELSSDCEHLRAKLYEEVQDAVREEMRDEVQDAVREIKEREDEIKKKTGRDGVDDEVETTIDGERLEAKPTRDGADDTKTFESQ